MPQTLLFCDFDLQFQGRWWPLKGQILAIFLHFVPVLIYRKLDRPMGGIYNTVNDLFSASALVTAPYLFFPAILSVTLDNIH